VLPIRELRFTNVPAVKDSAARVYVRVCSEVAIMSEPHNYGA